MMGGGANRPHAEPHEEPPAHFRHFVGPVSCGSRSRSAEFQLATVDFPVDCGTEFSSERAARRGKGCGSWVVAPELALTATSLLPYAFQLRDLLVTRCVGATSGVLHSVDSAWILSTPIKVQIPDPIIYHLCDFEKVT